MVDFTHVEKETSHQKEGFAHELQPNTHYTNLKTLFGALTNFVSWRVLKGYYK